MLLHNIQVFALVLLAVCVALIIWFSIEISNEEEQSAARTNWCIFLAMTILVAVMSGFALFVFHRKPNVMKVRPTLSYMAKNEK